MKITIEIEASLDATQDVLKSIASVLDGKADPVVKAETPAEVGPVKTAKTAKTAKKSETTKEAEAPAETKSEPETKDDTETTYTLVQVREKLAELSRAGKQAQVKALIEKHGASKLSEIKEESYAALMKEAEELQ